MAGKVIINSQRCKGCGLCIKACPQRGIVIAGQSNESGYLPAQVCGDDCSGCGMCAIVCPDAAIEVYRQESEIAAVETKKKSKPGLAKERR